MLFATPCGFICPPMSRRMLASSAGSSPILPHAQAVSRHEGRRDGLYPSLSFHTARGVIDKQVSALNEKCCSTFEAASMINTELWLSLLLTGFQMMAVGGNKSPGINCLRDYYRMRCFAALQCLLKIYCPYYYMWLETENHDSSPVDHKTSSLFYCSEPS